MTRNLDGIINLDKSAGQLSARVVDAVKRLLPRKTKIGHAGTLDAFATGVLLLLVGRGTRSCERLMDAPKEYEATVKLGATTATDDPDAPEEPLPAARSCTQAEIEALLPRFTGRILQTPPAFSALKIGGRRASDLVRQGEQVILEPRPVQVYALAVRRFEWPLLDLHVRCGRGTYVRSLARDIGRALGSGGYVTQLRRTRIGEFAIEQAVTLERLQAGGVEPHLHPLPAG